MIQTATCLNPECSNEFTLNQRQWHKKFCCHACQRAVNKPMSKGVKTPRVLNGDCTGRQRRFDASALAEAVRGWLTVGDSEVTA
jgi:hypothetical protein